MNSYVHIWREAPIIDHDHGGMKPHSTSRNGRDLVNPTMPDFQDILVGPIISYNKQQSNMENGLGYNNMNG